jgi:hypothetical protein
MRISRKLLVLSVALCLAVFATACSKASPSVAPSSNAPAVAQTSQPAILQVTKLADSCEAISLKEVGDILNVQLEQVGSSQLVEQHGWNCIYTKKSADAVIVAINVLPARDHECGLTMVKEANLGDDFGCSNPKDPNGTVYAWRGNWRITAGVHFDVPLAQGQLPPLTKAILRLFLDRFAVS